MNELEKLRLCHARQLIAGYKCVEMTSQTGKDCSACEYHTENKEAIEIYAAGCRDVATVANQKLSLIDRKIKELQGAL